MYYTSIKYINILYIHIYIHTHSYIDMHIQIYIINSKTLPSATKLNIGLHKQSISNIVIASLS